MQNTHLITQLKELLKRKRNKQYYATKLGISVRQVEELFEQMRGNKEESPTYTHERSANIEDGTLKSVLELDFEPKDIDQLYTLHKVDRQKYKITNYWSKLKSNKKFTSSVLASAKKPKDYNQDDFAKFLLTYNPKPLTINKTEDSGYKEVVDIELSVADFHLAKKTINNETLAERTEVFMRMCRNLIERAHSIYRINTVVFVISNDFFHTDTFGNTTTNGTPQEVITTYDHEYEVGFDLLVSAISLLKEYAREVHVVLVQGNHDRTKSFYVAHALEVFFKGEKNITFDRKHSTTKSVVLGNTFIGYHHGNCKMDDLPLLFATGNDSADFGNSKFREVHTGDKHHYLCKEVKGVRIQQLPSLSAPDTWHSDHNYVNNIRAAILMMYHPTRGKIGELEERIDNDY